MISALVHASLAAPEFWPLLLAAAAALVALLPLVFRIWEDDSGACKRKASSLPASRQFAREKTTISLSETERGARIALVDSCFHLERIEQLPHTPDNAALASELRRANTAARAQLSEFEWSRRLLAGS